MHFNLVHWRLGTKYTKIKCLQNILDLQYSAITTSVDRKEDMLVSGLAENPHLTEEVKQNLYSPSNGAANSVEEM